MPALNNTQRDYLRRMAHDLKPIVQIGKLGLTSQVYTSIEQTLSTHELIKIKFQDFRDEKRELAEEISSSTGSTLISIIGNIAIIYREQRDPEKRKIILPA